MSDQAHAETGHPPAEADQIRSWTIVGVGVASLLLFAAASVLTVAFLHRRQAELNPAWNAFPSEAGQRKIGMVEQQLFENANRARTLAAEKQRQLSTYGWVDRQRGVVRLPIDRAIDLTLEGQRP